jgi:hypothetical protein
MFLDADFGDREGPAKWEDIADRTGLTRPTIYRDVKAMRDAGIIVQLGPDHYLLPLDDQSMTVDGLSTPVDLLSTPVDRTSLTELQSIPEPHLDPLLGFDHFWPAYPKRDGKRLERGKCEALWRKLTLDQRRAAYIGAQHYAQAVNDGLTIAKDPARWLRDKSWTDWQEPATPSGQSGSSYVNSHGHTVHT